MALVNQMYTNIQMFLYNQENLFLFEASTIIVYLEHQQ